MSEPVRSNDAEAGSQIESRSRVRRRRRQFILAAVVLLVVVVVVPPFISLNRFRRTILHSISAGLGRPVEASAVELQLFPRPGFVLHNLTVGEDPAYGAEPVMISQTVTAGLRASTLWHGRVEIATLRFDAPSVNLVRDAAGHWNFESLLRKSPALHGHGTAQAGRSGNHLPFPYVEATEARINFKLGVEKLPFSLERANLSLWKESTHEWRLRLRANPVRTDLTMEDAGQIRGEGRLITGGTLMNAPIRARLEWRRVDLGEINRLLHAEDNGWRGTVDWTGHAQGTLADVALTSDIAVEGFRRVEFIPATEMDLSAHCVGRYAHGNAALDSLTCDAPAGGGHLWMRGFAAAETTPQIPTAESAGTRDQQDASRFVPARPAAPAGTRVQIELRKISAGFFLDLLAHVHPGVAPDASLTGEVNGAIDCAWQGMHMPEACTGKVGAAELRLQLAHRKHPLLLSPVTLTSSSPEQIPAVWDFSPVHVALGGATPATIGGAVSSVGATFKVTGSADLEELRNLAQSLRVPAISGEVRSLQGSAQLALTVESSWTAASEMGGGSGTSSEVGVQAGAGGVQPGQSVAPTPSRWTGTVQLRDATVQLASLPVPLELTSAQIELDPSAVKWMVLNGSFAHIPFDGSIRWHTPCPASTSACARSFALHSTNLSTDRLQAALHNSAGAGDLLNLINPWAGGMPQLPEITGKLDADVLSMSRMSLKNATLHLRLKGRSAELMGISGKVFGGTISAAAGSENAGTARWGDGAPAYTLHVNLERIQPDNVGAMWHERWGGGVADAQMDVKTQGWTAAQLAQNATGQFEFDWANGVLPVATGTPINFKRWDAKGSLRNQVLALDSSKMVPQISPQRRGLVSPVTQSVIGTVTFARMLNLHFAPSGISIAGPLSASVVKSLSK